MEAIFDELLPHFSGIDFTAWQKMDTFFYHLLIYYIRLFFAHFCSIFVEYSAKIQPKIQPKYSHIFICNFVFIFWSFQTLIFTRNQAPNFCQLASVLQSKGKILCVSLFFYFSYIMMTSYHVSQISQLDALAKSDKKRAEGDFLHMLLLSLHVKMTRLNFLYKDIRS